MTFVIVDQLGNESRFENASTLFVGVTPTTSGSTLGDVTALSAVASDHRITLTWTAPTVVAAPLINYRVFYGLSPNQLTEAVDTFTNSTTWYIPNLKNGVEYYFAVVAVDSSGNTSEHLSNIVSSTPNPAVLNVPTPDVVNGTAGADILKEMDADVSETGPEVVWLLCLSVFGGAFYTLSSRRK
jgi:predicted phage tail protein